MKFKAAVWAAITVGVFVLYAPVTSSAQSTPSSTVKAFYKWYVHALNQNVAEPLKSDKAMARKYVTASFLHRIEKASAREEGLNADPFLSAQDFDKAWENNIVIKKTSTTGATSTVNAVLPSKQMGDQKLKIIMKKEGGLWKIDQVNERNI
jgi:hypothetical protein